VPVPPGDSPPPDTSQVRLWSNAHPTCRGIANVAGRGSLEDDRPTGHPDPYYVGDARFYEAIRAVDPHTKLCYTENGSHLLRFLYVEGLNAANNLTERRLRPAAVTRKTSDRNRIDGESPTLSFRPTCCWLVINRSGLSWTIWWNGNVRRIHRRLC
jgi:hypothetical protein